MKRLWDDVTEPEHWAEWSHVDYWLMFTWFGREVCVQVPRWLYELAQRKGKA